MERMTAVVIVTHGNAGADMIHAAQSFLRVEIQKLAAVEIEPADDRIRIGAKLDHAVGQLGADGDDDILFLVDLVGSTPARLCCSRCGGSGHVVTGVNMPMLIKLATADRGQGAVALGDELVATGTKSIHHE